MGEGAWSANGKFGKNNKNLIIYKNAAGIWNIMAKNSIHSSSMMSRCTRQSFFFTLDAAHHR